MRMSIARALKERKRIIGEMNTAWNRMSGSNAVQTTIRVVDGKYRRPTDEEFAAMRRTDPAARMEEWRKLQDRLIELKVALHKANDGAAETLARLGELKAELQLVECMGEYSAEERLVGESAVSFTDVVYDAKWAESRKDELRREINAAQDALDEYNATHYVELAEY